MRKIYLVSCIFLCQYVLGQNNVGIGIATPDPSAILDLTSGDQGFLAPRMNAASRLAITAPATGLIVYDLDSMCTFFYTGTAWQNMCVTAGGYNDSIYFNSIGTVSVVDKGGTKTSPEAAWLTTGNTGTNPANNYAGTTDANNFVLKANSNEVMRLTTAGAVDIGNPAVEDPNAILNINSSTLGVLFPNLTSAARDAIVAPTPGLTIYNTTLNVHQYYNGTCWANVGQTVCSFTYNFTESHTTDCLFKSNFGTVSDTLTVGLVAGTASPVILSAEGVPAGVLVNFSNNYIIPTAGGVQSVMTMTALPSAPSGTYTITILATSGSTVETLTYTLTVYDFSVTLSPADTTISLAAAQAGGVIATATITIGNPSSCATNAGNAQLTYSISPSNPGLTVSFGNANLPVPGSTTMSITSSCALQGVYTITITSQVGVSVSTSTYIITILGPAPIYITANAQNVNLYTLAGTPACPVLDTFIVNAGVTIGSNSSAQTAGAAAMQTGQFVGGSKIVIINYGKIIGAGGTGGSGDGYGGAVIGGSCTMADGQEGGDALWINTANVTIDNFDTIASGGGGGGVGGALGVTECTLDVRPGTGGGGGAGSNGGAGGDNGNGSYPCSAGNNGTLYAGGTGGAICEQGPCTILFLTFGPFNAGQGGTGGPLGGTGSAGNNASDVLGGAGVCSPGNGGAPGYSLVGNGNSPTYNGAASGIIGPQLP